MKNGSCFMCFNALSMMLICFPMLVSCALPFAVETHSIPNGFHATSVQSLKRRMDLGIEKKSWRRFVLDGSCR